MDYVLKNCLYSIRTRPCWKTSRILWKLDTRRQPSVPASVEFYEAYPRTERMVETAKKAEQGAKHRSEGLAVKTILEVPTMATA